MKQKITYEMLIEDSKKLAEKIKKDRSEQEKVPEYSSVYGIPTGGLIPAFIVAQEMKLPLAVTPDNNSLVVDDLIDSGKTLEKFPHNDCAVLYIKEHSPKVRYYQELVKGWIFLPHEQTSLEKGVEDHIVRILEYIGENPNREGLKDTPKRVAKMYGEIFGGYDKSKKPRVTTFPNNDDGVFYDQMIYDSGYFYSHCEHHMVPFFGTYHFAYIPYKEILGLSKIARLIDWHAARLQIQERLVKDIVDDLELAIGELKPDCVAGKNGMKQADVALVLKGRHLCKEMRGVKKFDTAMITSDMRGAFKNNIETRTEFFKLVKL